MNCPKCGQENEENIKNCKNCGFTLHNHSKVSDAIEDNLLKNQNVETGSALLDSHKDVPLLPVEEELKENYTQLGNQPSCPKCSYPLIDVNSKCPNCNFDKEKTNALEKTLDIKETLINVDIDDVALNEKVIAEVVTENPIENEDSIENYKVKFSALTIDGNNHKDLHFKEDNELKGRQEIDQNDSFISKEHFSLSQKDGVWSIENIASNNATFLAVRGKTELKDGDIILIGHSKFYKVEIKGS